jgi:hypothetical protein
VAGKNFRICVLLLCLHAQGETTGSTVECVQCSVNELELCYKFSGIESLQLHICSLKNKKVEYFTTITQHFSKAGEAITGEEGIKIIKEQ